MKVLDDAKCAYNGDLNMTRIHRLEKEQPDKQSANRRVDTLLYSSYITLERNTSETGQKLKLQLLANHSIQQRIHRK